MPFDHSEQLRPDIGGCSVGQILRFFGSGNGCSNQFRAIPGADELSATTLSRGTCAVLSVKDEGAVIIGLMLPSAVALELEDVTTNSATSPHKIPKAAALLRNDTLLMNSSRLESPRGYM